MPSLGDNICHNIGGTMNHLFYLSNWWVCNGATTLIRTTLSIMTFSKKTSHIYIIGIKLSAISLSVKQQNLFSLNESLFTLVKFLVKTLVISQCYILHALASLASATQTWLVLLFVRSPKVGEISCQFLPPSGSIVPRYVSQLLFREKSQNC